MKPTLHPYFIGKKMKVRLAYCLSKLFQVRTQAQTPPHQLRALHDLFCLPQLLQPSSLLLKLWPQQVSSFLQTLKLKPSARTLPSLSFLLEACWGLALLLHSGSISLTKVDSSSIGSQSTTRCSFTVLNHCCDVTIVCKGIWLMHLSFIDCKFHKGWICAEFYLPLYPHQLVHCLSVVGIQ